MSITAKCILGLALLLGGGASTWWAARGTADEAVDSGIELAEDAPTVEAALVLDIDIPGVPKGSPRIEFVAEPSVQPTLVLDVDVPGVPTGSATIEFVAEPSVR